jgi:hypothetical protein
MASRKMEIKIEGLEALIELRGRIDDLLAAVESLGEKLDALPKGITEARRATPSQVEALEKFAAETYREDVIRAVVQGTREGSR